MMYPLALLMRAFTGRLTVKGIVRNDVACQKGAAR
jgi:hypothetical protein